MHCCQYINCNNKIGCIWFGKENSFTQQNVTNSVPNFISRGESKRFLSSTGFTNDLKVTSVFIQNIYLTIRQTHYPLTEQFIMTSTSQGKTDTCWTVPFFEHTITLTSKVKCPTHHQFMFSILCKTISNSDFWQNVMDWANKSRKRTYKALLPLWQLCRASVSRLNSYTELLQVGSTEMIIPVLLYYYQWSMCVFFCLVSTPSVFHASVKLTHIERKFKIIVWEIFDS